MPPKLGDILVQAGACSGGAVRDALKNQVIFGGRLGTNLLEVGAVSEEALARALGRQHGVPALSGDLALDRGATALLTREIADRCDAIPYVVADRRLGLLVVDPRNLATLDEAAFATGKEVHPIVVPEARLWVLLRKAYGIDRHLRGLDVEFAKLRAEASRAAAAAGSRPAAEPVADLMDESAFDALYAGPAFAGGKAPAPPAPPTSTATATATPTPTPTSTSTPTPTPTPTPTSTSTSTPTSNAPSPDDVIELTDLLQSEPTEAEPWTARPAAEALLSAHAHVPPSRLVRPTMRLEAPEPTPLKFDEALRFLEGVDDRESIAKTVLRYARSKFRRAVLLTVHGGAANGWAGLGEKLGAEAVRHIHLALGTPGIVDTVVRTQAHFLGPIPKTEANIRLLKALGGGVPGNAFLVPILAMGRVVNVFYADNGRGGVVDAGNVGELLILATRIAKSYDTLVARVR